MGRNKFGPQRGPWENLDWQGWWGDDPPFHTAVFVLTHHHRPDFTLADTTFHFVEAAPGEVLRQAKEAAGGKDVRIGGGVATIRQFLEADLIDTSMWRWRRSRSVGGSGSGPPPRSCSIASTSRPSPAPAASPTRSSDGDDDAGSNSRKEG
jgi:hypothetical protein